MSNDFIYTQEEMRELTAGCRIACDYLMRYKTPYSLFLEDKTYFEYIMKYKSDIIRFLPIDYMGFKHKHMDSYIHFSRNSDIEKILKEGYLRVDNSNEINSVGKAVYTYPLKSGIFFGNNDSDSSFLVFESEQEHCHITQTNDTPCCIGEADFFSDVKLINPRVFTFNEINDIIKDNFNWKNAQKEYYGIDVIEDATYDTFLNVLEHYNDDFHHM